MQRVVPTYRSQPDLRGGFFAVACLLSSALLLSGGCAKLSSGRDPEYISFSAPGLSLGAVETRSELLTGFPDGGVFGVVGYCVPHRHDGAEENDWESAASAWRSKQKYAYPDVFRDVQVTRRGESCDYTPLRRWYADSDLPAGVSVRPDDFLYTFFAWFPYGSSFLLDNPSGPHSEGAPRIRFTMPFSGSSTDAVRAHTAIPDAMLSSVYNVRRRDGKVAFVFDHILSGLRFRVNNYHASDAVTVRSLSLRGEFYRTKRFDFAEVTAPATVIDGTFGGTFVLQPSGEVRTVPAGQSLPVGAPLLLLPDERRTDGTALGRSLEIVVTYTFGRRTRSRTLSFKPGGKVLPGVCYTVGLNFIGDSFVVEFRPDNDENWEDGSDNDHTIQ